MAVEDRHEDREPARARRAAPREPARRRGRCRRRARRSCPRRPPGSARDRGRRRAGRAARAKKNAGRIGCPVNAGAGRERQRREDEDPALAGDGNPQWATPSRWLRAIASMRSLIRSFSFLRRFSSISSSSESRGFAGQHFEPLLVVAVLRREGGGTPDPISGQGLRVFDSPSIRPPCRFLCGGRRGESQDHGPSLSAAGLSRPCRNVKVNEAAADVQTRGLTTQGRTSAKASSPSW